MLEDIGTTIQQIDNGNPAGWLWLFLIAFAAFVVIAIIAHYVAAGLQAISQRATHSPAIGNLVGMLVRVVAYVIALFVALRIMRLDGVAYSLLAGAGVVGIVLGFALQDIAANFISGIILSIQRPFRIGHLIYTNEIYGIVRKIHLRSTEIKTLDGQLVHIPNKSILLETVTDYNYIPFRRVDLTIGVGYDADLELVKQVTLEVVAGLESCVSDHPVELFFTEFADSSINFEVRFWTNFANETDYLAARSEAVMAIKSAYVEHDIEIPYPITTVIGGDPRGGAV